MQPLTWCIIPSAVAPGIDFNVATYFVLFLILYGSMFLTIESPRTNNLFANYWDCCDVFLAFFFSGLLILLMQLSTSEETKLLSARPELDGNSSTDLLADKVGLFRGLLVVSCAMFKSFLLNCSSITFSRAWNWFLVSIVKLLRASRAFSLTKSYLWWCSTCYWRRTFLCEYRCISFAR